VSDPQERDISWFEEWEEITDEEREPEITGQEDAERRLWVVARLRSDLKEIDNHAANEMRKIQQWQVTRASGIQNQMSWLERGLRAFVEGAGKKSMTLINGSLSLRSGRESVAIEDEAAFIQTCLDKSEDGLGFVRVKEVKSPDKKAILAHIKETGEIPSGCELVYGKTSFTIKTGE